MVAVILSFSKRSTLALGSLMVIVAVSPILYISLSKEMVGAGVGF